MCNRARLSSEPETLFERFGATWAQDVVRPNKDPQELYPKSKAFVVRDERGGSDRQSRASRGPAGYEVSTAKMSAGTEGISTTMLSDYLDRHIDGGKTFVNFVDEYFEGTPFLSQMLKTAKSWLMKLRFKFLRRPQLFLGTAIALFLESH